jgi:hypothetical protein
MSGGVKLLVVSEAQTFSRIVDHTVEWINDGREGYLSIYNLVER